MLVTRHFSKSARNRRDGAGRHEHRQRGRPVYAVVDDLQGRADDAEKVANNLPTNPNCVGENVSPQLSWSGVPDGTKSSRDHDGRPGRSRRSGRQSLGRIRHPAPVTSFAEGEAQQASDKYVGGKSTQGVGTT